MANLPQSIANPARTGVQMGAAAIIVEFIDAFFYDLSERQYAALVALLILVVSFVQNLYEQYKDVYFLKPKQLTES